MIDNKDEYKILIFLKGNVGFASLLITLLGVLFTAVGNYLYYIFMYSYLLSWNIPGSFAANIHTKQMNIIVMVFVSLLFSFVINQIIVSATENIVLYDDLIRCNRNKIEILQFKSNELQKQIREEKLSINQDKAIKKKTNISSKDLRRIENSIKQVETDLCSQKKEIKKISCKMFFHYVGSLLFCSLLTFVFYFVFFYYLFDNMVELIKSVFITCLPFLFLSFLFIVVNLIFKLSKNKKFSQIDEIDKRINSIHDELDRANKKRIMKFFNDKFIISFLCLIIFTIVVFLFVLPWSARQSVYNQHEFTIVNYDSACYVLVYYDETNAYLKKCIISNENIKIDRDSFIITDSSNIEFQIKEFSNVDISDFDLI